MDQSLLTKVNQSTVVRNNCILGNCIFRAHETQWLYTRLYLRRKQNLCLQFHAKKNRVGQEGIFYSIFFSIAYTKM